MLKLCKSDGYFPYNLRNFIVPLVCENHFEHCRGLGHPLLPPFAFAIVSEPSQSWIRIAIRRKPVQSLAARSFPLFTWCVSGLLLHAVGKDALLRAGREGGPRRRRRLSSLGNRICGRKALYHGSGTGLVF